MSSLMTTMMNSISDVMETMFFMPVEFEEKLKTIKTIQDQGDPVCACRLKFSGDYSGAVYLTVPKTLLAEMTENFMGESEDHLKEEHLSGTLTETLNMICGSALGKVESNEPFALAIPEIVQLKDIPETLEFHIVNTPLQPMGVHVGVEGR